MAWLLSDALQDSFAKLHVIDAHGEAMAHRYPRLALSLPSTVRWLLAAVGGTHCRLSDLARRYP